MQLTLLLSLTLIAVFSLEFKIWWSDDDKLDASMVLGKDVRLKEVAVKRVLVKGNLLVGDLSKLFMQSNTNF